MSSKAFVLATKKKKQNNMQNNQDWDFPTDSFLNLFDEPINKNNVPAKQKNKENIITSSVSLTQPTAAKTPVIEKQKNTQNTQKVDTIANLLTNTYNAPVYLKDLKKNNNLNQVCDNNFDINCNKISDKQDNILATDVSGYKNLDENKYIDIFVINLKQRTDRKISIIEQFKKFKKIKLNFFEAYKETDGRIGCAKSHIALINHAQRRNMNYIIVIEDDFIFNEKIIDKFYFIIQTLIREHKTYDIFNGSPTFWDKRDTLDEICKYISPIRNFYNITNAQKTTFMIYTKKIYNRVLNGYDPFLSQLHIDQFLANTFIQLCYEQYICYEKAGYSNIANKNIDNIEYIKQNEDFYINLKCN